MKKRQLLPLIMISLLSTESNAQFKRFRSKTRFKNKAPSVTQPKMPEVADEVQEPVKEEESTPSSDYFGRKTGNSGIEKNKKESKYVNLNPETAFGPEIVTSFDFPNADIMQVTKHMQRLTGINLILDKDVKGKISISAPTAITVGDAWKAYLAALNMNGYTLVKSGAFYKIIHNRDVRYAPTKIYTGTYTPNTENYVMRVLPLRHIDAVEVTRTFRPFMSRYGRLLELKQTNTIIIADTGANINRLVKLINFLDVPGHEESLQIIKVQYSSAEEIAKMLDQILKGNSRGSRTSTSKTKTAKNIKVIAEKRTNSLIAMVNNDDGKMLKNLVKKLDVPLIAKGSGRIHVYYLNYGDAESLAKTLTNLVSNSKQSRSSRSSRRSSRFTNTSSSGSIFNDDVKISADKPNNALVVTASPTDYLTIKTVLTKLDVPRDQVYIEGLIMETSIDKVRSFGTSIIGAYGSGAAQRAGFDGTGKMVDFLSGNFTSLGGLFVGGGSGAKVEIPGPAGNVTVNTVNGLISAIASHSTTNVLATPQILVLDNTDGTFEIGEEVPIPSNTNTANGSTQTTFDYKQISLKLKITPQINKVTRFIKLKIDQKADDFSGKTFGNSSVPGKTIRAAQTTVVVRDRDTIAMGGLMRDKESESINKVPLLGDIPVLGWLFKSKNKTVVKTNMLFFLTPKILSSYEKTAAATGAELINRRNTHLKEAVGGDIPNKTTTKALYDKFQRQKKGPLYDKEDQQNEFLRNNQDSVKFEAPDYKNIINGIQKNGKKLSAGMNGTINTEG